MAGERVPQAGRDYSAFRLLIGTPTSDGTVTVAYLHSLCNTLRLFQELRLGWQVLSSTGAAVDAARNGIVAQFMADPAFTHLLFIDEDHGWDPAHIIRLLAAGKDVIGIAARRKSETRAWAVGFMPSAQPIEGGLLEVATVGSGFLLIRRQAIERMFQAFPHLKITEPPTGVAPEMAPHYYALFQHSIREGRLFSEDLTFCARWREIGGRNFIDPFLGISHLGTRDYAGAIAQDIVPAPASPAGKAP